MTFFKFSSFQIMNTTDTPDMKSTLEKPKLCNKSLSIRYVLIAVLFSQQFNLRIESIYLGAKDMQMRVEKISFSNDESLRQKNAPAKTDGSPGIDASHYGQ